MSRKFEIMRRIPAKTASWSSGCKPPPEDDIIAHFVRMQRYFDRTRNAETWLRENGEPGETYLIVKIAKKVEVFQSDKKTLISMVI